MMVARVARDFWTNPKRLRLERELRGQFADAPRKGPMCAGECVCLILAWLDHRNCPRGTLTDSDAPHLEDAAGWKGDDGVLWTALVDVRFIVQAKGGGLEWKDFAILNGDTIRKRMSRRAKSTSQDGTRDRTQDIKGDGTRDGQGDQTRGSGSGSSLSSSSTPQTPKGADIRKARRQGRRRDPADRNPAAHRAITAAWKVRGWATAFCNHDYGPGTFTEVVERSPLSDDQLIAAISEAPGMAEFVATAAPWMNGAA